MADNWICICEHRGTGVPCLATLVQMEIVCGCRAYIHPAVGGRRFVLVTIDFVGVAVFVFVNIGGQLLPGNFGENGNSLMLLSFYTPNCFMRMHGVSAINALMPLC